MVEQMCGAQKCGNQIKAESLKFEQNYEIKHIKEK